MLTPEQHQIRTRGIGGSDLPALLGLPAPGRRTIVDVWLRKRRGPGLELPPHVEDWDEDQDKPSAFAPYLRGDARDAGSVLEDAIARLYTLITGLDVARVRPLVGRQPWHRANVDRVTGPDLASRRYISAKRPRWRELGVDRGVEIKLVGEWPSKQWPEDGIPDYVRVQCQWYMGITGLPRWDVIGLLTGTDPRIVRVERDEGVIAGLEDVVDAFWRDHVLADRPPPTEASDQAMTLLRALSPEPDQEPVEDEAPEVVAAMAHLVRTREQRKALQQREQDLAAALAMRCGRREALLGSYGRFTFTTRRGTIDWKAVAHELAPDGVVPDEVQLRHRRPATRVAQAYPHKGWVRDVVAAGHVDALLEAIDDRQVTKALRAATSKDTE